MKGRRQPSLRRLHRHENAVQQPWLRAASDAPWLGAVQTSRPILAEFFRCGDNGLTRAVNEVKTGDGRLDSRALTQIAKDAHLLNTRAVTDYTWNFFPSGRSNRVGPDPEMLAELKKVPGMKIKVWLP